MLDRQSQPAPTQPVTLARAWSSESVFPPVERERPPDLSELHGRWAAGEGGVQGQSGKLSLTCSAEDPRGPQQRGSLFPSLLMAGAGEQALSRRPGSPALALWQPAW